MNSLGTQPNAQVPIAISISHLRTTTYSEQRPIPIPISKPYILISTSSITHESWPPLSLIVVSHSRILGHKSSLCVLRLQSSINFSHASYLLSLRQVFKFYLFLIFLCIFFRHYLLLGNFTGRLEGLTCLYLLGLHRWKLWFVYFYSIFFVQNLNDFNMLNGRTFDQCCLSLHQFFYVSDL